MVKCCSAALIAHIAAPYFPEGDASWFFISIILVLSPDSKEVIPLAMTRIKANILASIVSLILMFIGLPSLLGICIGFCITIILCNFLNLMLGARPALAAVIIIMLHQQSGIKLWELAASRAGYVVAGCLTGLILTLIFHRSFKNQPTSNLDPGGE